MIFQDQVGAWLSNDGANHRVALLAFPNFVDDPEKDTRTGMHHSAFEYDSFEELNSSYLRLKEAGITPALCLDHGMTFSYYYADPDGNNVELQVDNFGDWEKSKEWMRTSEEFKANPIGQFVDPDAGRRRPRRRDELRRDPRQGDGRRLRARAGAGRDPGGVVMRLCRFDAGDGPRRGIVEDGYVVDRDDAAERHALEDVRLLAPVQPRKFLAIGLNYADHIAESGMEAPAVPGVLQQAGHLRGRPRRRRPHAARLEPARLRGRAGDRDRPPLPPRARGARARGDRRLHDHQRRLGARLAAAHADDDDGQVVRHPRAARALDGHPDELGDPHDLSIRTYVNDELRQDGNTREMIYDCYQQVAHLSEAFTLEPGDVIATGTPAGIGAVRQPFPEGLLKVGDVVRIEIEGIGELANTVVEEPDGYLPRGRAEVAWVR